jgi:hypothetical protein
MCQLIFNAFGVMDICKKRELPVWVAALIAYHISVRIAAASRILLAMMTKP